MPCPESFEDLLALQAEIAPNQRVRAIVALHHQFTASMYRAEDHPHYQEGSRSWLLGAGLEPYLLGEPGEVRVRHLLSLPEVDLSSWVVSDELLPGGAAIVSATPSALSRLAKSDAVLRVEPDTVYRTGLDTVGPTLGTATAHQSGWDGTDVSVAVIDTGIDAAHPAFAGRISAASQNFTTEGTSSDVGDRNGHGTHVAAIVGGSGAPSGTYRGVAPGCELLILKALDATGTGSAGDIAAAVSCAISNGAHVLNFSGGDAPWNPPASLVGPPWLWSTSPTFEELMFMAAVATGIVTVVAAGNFGCLSRPDGTVTRPARLEPVVSVGSVDTGGTSLSSFSSRGPVRQSGSLGAGRVVTDTGSAASASAEIVKPDVVAPGGERDDSVAASGVI